MIDAATQQHGLQAATGVPDRDLPGMGTVGKGGTPLVGPLRAVDERRQTAARPGGYGVAVAQQYSATWEPGYRFPAAQGLVCGWCTVTRVPGWLTGPALSQ